MLHYIMSFEVGLPTIGRTVIEALSVSTGIEPEPFVIVLAITARNDAPQVSPQVAAAIAVGDIGGIVEIIKALLPIISK